MYVARWVVVVAVVGLVACAREPEPIFEFQPRAGLNGQRGMAQCYGYMFKSHYSLADRSGDLGIADTIALQTEAWPYAAHHCDRYAFMAFHDDIVTGVHAAPPGRQRLYL